MPLPIRFAAARWFRFRLRTLFLVTAVVAVALVPFTLRTRTQRLAHEIRFLHGRYEIFYDGPEWVRRCFGRRVDYEIIGPLDGFRSVELGQSGGTTSPPPTKVRDEWLRNLNGQRDVRELGLSWTMITDDGIRSLKDLPQLQEVRVQGLRITDASVRHISTFSTMERLDLRFTPVTDDGISSLTQVVGLKHLRLRRTAITDNAVDVLRTMRSLEYLDLSWTDVSDGRRRCCDVPCRTAISTDNVRRELGKDARTIACTCELEMVC